MFLVFLVFLLLKNNIKIENGYAHLPNKPGLGIDLDWDFIDNTTFKIL